MSTTPHLAGPGDASSESGPTGLALAVGLNWKKRWGAMNQRSGEKRCEFFVPFFCVEFVVVLQNLLNVGSVGNEQFGLDILRSCFR